MRGRSGADMLEKSNSQYESFMFWRQPIPALDLSELEGVECSEYSAFHYWRQPIAHIDSLMADLNQLLL
ncbi:hypothetical protein CRUP_009350 [Coryphaenoides rupestris]|nr:hypothetical protein CRUP_009350 [Coryphaenoides rupestris]